MTPLPQAVLTALQDQLTLERQNAEFYDALAYGLDNVSWPGSSQFMADAAAEERRHAQKVAGYLIDRNVPPEMAGLEPVQVLTTADPVPYFAAALEREKLTTEAIRALYFTGEQEDDPQTCQFLQWFLQEQTRSERELVDKIAELSRCGVDGRVVLDAKYGGESSA